MNEFAERLKQVRKERKLKQKDLTKLANIKGNQLSTYENGRVIPSESNLEALIIALRLPWDYFDDTLPYTRTIRSEEILQKVQKFIDRNPTNDQSQTLLKLVDSLTKTAGKPPIDLVKTS